MLALPRLATIHETLLLPDALSATGDV